MKISDSKLIRICCAHTLYTLSSSLALYREKCQGMLVKIQFEAYPFILKIIPVYKVMATLRRIAAMYYNNNPEATKALRSRSFEMRRYGIYFFHKIHFVNQTKGNMRPRQTFLSLTIWTPKKWNNWLHKWRFPFLLLMEERYSLRRFCV